jgi:hypothetical protein
MGVAEISSGVWVIDTYSNIDLISGYFAYAASILV